MTISYRLGFGDRLAFAAYHFPRSLVFVLVILGGFLLLTFEDVLPAARSLPGNPPIFTKILVFMVGELMLGIACLLFLAVLMLLTMVSKRNKTLYAQRTLTVKDEGLVSESEYGRSELKWKLVQKLGRTKNHVFMYLSGENAVVVPRRAFENAAQWDTFFDICKRGRSGVV